MMFWWRSNFLYLFHRNKYIMTQAEQERRFQEKIEKEIKIEPNDWMPD